MGMTPSAHWECERCTEAADVKIGNIPEGWSWVGQGDLWVDASDYSVDYKLPREKSVLCDKCSKSYTRWLGSHANKDANAEQASSTTPVDSPSVTTEVSDKEKNKDEGNRTHAMEDIVPDEELPERNCERDFPHEVHPFIDDKGKEFVCPGIKNVDIRDDLV